jgi:hypothetical protein
MAPVHEFETFRLGGMIVTAAFTSGFVGMLMASICSAA